MDIDFAKYDYSVEKFVMCIYRASFGLLAACVQDFWLPPINADY